MEKSAGGSERNGSNSNEESNRSSKQRSPPVLLETLADRVPEPVLVVDEELVVIGVNERFEAFAGLPSSVIKGEPLSWLFPSVGRPDIEHHCHDDGNHDYLMARFTRGSDAWVDLAFDRQQWGEETYYLGLVHDVTDRQERIRLLEQYERIVETIEDGVYTLDESFTIETVNSAVESMTGYSEEMLVGSSAMLLADDSTLDEAATISREILTGERDAGTLTTTLRTAEGGKLPVETRFTTYDLADTFRQVGVVRDISDRKRFERRLEALHNATRQLLHAETNDEVATQIVETATDVLELPAAQIYRFDPTANVLSPIAASGSGIEADSDLEPIAAGSGPLWKVFVDSEPAEVDATDVDLLAADVAKSDSMGLCLPLDTYGVFFVETSAGRDDHLRELIDLLAASAQAAFARVDRESALRDREAELQARNSELQQLKQVNEIIRRIDRVLVDADTAESIEQAVCEQLAESDLFSFAWIGRRDESELVPRAWEGASANYLDTLSLSISDEKGPPAVQTANSGTMTVVPSIADNLHDEPWRSEAVSRTLQSAISVPLQYHDFSYGVLTVYADRPSAFGEKLQAVLAELGESIANAIREVESRKRQAADSVVEVALSLNAPETFLQQLATALDTTLWCDGAVPNGTNTSRLFLRIDGAAADDVTAQIESMVSVEEVMEISDDGEMNRYEVVVTEPTIPGTLLDLAAAIVSIRAKPTETAVEIHLGGDSEVRTFVERLQQRYPKARLTARREETVTQQTRGGIRPALAERLTERQFEVLKTAYLSGFFEWPRESTGQDIAAMLDVSQPTVNRHIRKAERKLFDLVFDEE